MKESLSSVLRCPACAETLSLQTFVTEPPAGSAHPSVREGVLLCLRCKTWYPITSYVPVMLVFPISLHDRFSRAFRERLLALGEYSPPRGHPEPGERSVQATFTEEWDTVQGDELSFTYTKEQLKDLHRTVFLDPLAVPRNGERTVLNVGVGLGNETKALQEVTDSHIFAVDLNLALLSSAGRYEADPNIHFVVASLFHLPFPPSSFDLVYSHGVIHHTYSTRAAFKSLAAQVRRNGYLSVWVYGLEDHLVRHGILGLLSRAQRLIELPLRPVISRSPAMVRTVFFAAAGVLLHPLYKMRQVNKGQWKVRNTIHGLRDWLSPRYAHRHGWNEVLEWFEDSGLKIVAPHSPHAYRKLMGKRLWGVGVLGQKFLEPQRRPDSMQ